ncbi:MAG: hypothetical protein JF587_17605 [Catenulisporales bacterium]|nr:hypothetical protein [Catenulisporales bacterium]
MKARISRAAAAATAVLMLACVAACSGGGSPKASQNPSGAQQSNGDGHGAPGTLPGTSAPASASSLDVRAENAQPGDPAWKNGIDSGDDHGIEGFADQVGVTSGQSFKLYVSTVAQQFAATAFRIGYYNGAQGRQIWKSAPTPGRIQPAAAIRPQVNTVTANWQPSLTVPTAGWPEGSYLIRLDPLGIAGKAGAKGARFVPITVRSTSATDKVVLINAVTTWQAYNAYGGYDLYSGGPKNDYANRARIVSFDRPYDSTGADRFQTYEQSSIVFTEKLAAEHGLHQHRLPRRERGLPPHPLPGLPAGQEPNPDRL